MSNIKLSIITPVYNGEKYVVSCIKCVIDQNCPECEHIIIDGGSTDRTVDIIKEYSDKYSHIRWISEKDQGQSDAMNKGIFMSRGSIISFLNSDDYYEPNVLNRILEIFTSLPENSFLVGNCNWWDIHGDLQFINKPKKLHLSDMLLGFRINPHPVNPSAYFYHKSLHDIVGYYKIDEHFLLDVDFIYRVVQVANVKYMDEVWGNFRFVEGTKSFKDYENQKSFERHKTLTDKYLKQLNPYKRLKVKLLRKIIPLTNKYFKPSNKTKYYLSRISYYIKNPLKFLDSTLRKN